MSRKLGDLPVGTLVKESNTKYNNEPIVWKIADKNHSGYPSNSVTLITDKIISLKCIDAREPRNSDHCREVDGNNRYTISNIRQWLNASGNYWYSPKHPYDAPPNSNNTKNNPYENEPGLLSGFYKDFISSMLSTNLIVIKNSRIDGGGYENFTDKIFLVSRTEAGLGNETRTAEGSTLSLFSNSSNLLTKPTPQAVSKNSYESYKISENLNYDWWFRTPNDTSTKFVCKITGDGTFKSQSAYVGYTGIRPLCNVKSDILVSGTAGNDGVYEILFNRPPSKPSTITVPNKIYINKATNISWSSASDPDGDRVSYVLERKINSDNWVQIYSGSSTNFNDTVTQKSPNTAQYRVKAVDNFNNNSDYLLSQSATIIHNVPPKISGTDEDLGVKNSNDFIYKYTVTDKENSKVTVIEKVDEMEIKTYTANLGQENTLKIDDETWLSLTNGEHVLNIIATDIDGGASERKITFTKQISELFVMLKKPVISKYKPTRIKVSVKANVPADAQMRIYVCNNANDESPTWEDISMFVKSNFAYVFANKIKTSPQWGVNINVIISRKNSEGDCYVKKIEGNFE